MSGLLSKERTPIEVKVFKSVTVSRKSVSGPANINCNAMANPKHL